VRQGIPLALANGDEHLAAADVLAENAKFGFAVAHLVYALEESEKARTLGKVVIGADVPAAQLRAALHEHRARHAGAVGKSRTSGATAMFMEMNKQRLVERLKHMPARQEDEIWEDALAAHPEVLPEDWAEKAGTIREQSLYVDLTESGWTSPSGTDVALYQRYRPAVARQLLYVRAAYEREVLGRGQQD
jgi:AbiV family abortive infection protein